MLVYKVTNMTIELVDENSTSSCKRGKYSDNELLEYLKRSNDEKGRPPTEEDFENNPKYPGSKTYQRRFGSWNKALDLAGLLDKRKIIREKEYTDEELLERLKIFEREVGRPPKVEDFKNDPKYPSLSTYIRRFGSWNSALQVAGLHTITGGSNKYTAKELLEFLGKFEKEEGRSPRAEDFINNPKYPSIRPYIDRFGSWQKALRLVGLDIDSMVKKGILETNQQKARLAEIFVLEHFAEKAIDLSGENPQSPYDGICPKNQIYDVKSSAFGSDHWSFALRNIRKDEIEWFYLLGFDKDWTKLEFVMRIPGSITDEDYMYIGLSSNYTYNLENMREYEITEKFKDIDFHHLNENSEEKKEKIK